MRSYWFIFRKNNIFLALFSFTSGDSIKKSSPDNTESKGKKEGSFPRLRYSEKWSDENQYTYNKQERIFSHVVIVLGLGRDNKYTGVP